MLHCYNPGRHRHTLARLIESYIESGQLQWFSKGFGPSFFWHERLASTLLASEIDLMLGLAGLSQALNFSLDT